MPTSLGDSRCSIARTLEVLGEKWTLLIVREALWGRTRFSQFREALGIAPDVLADRLGTLVAAGVLERRAYRSEGRREREEYVLTAAGEELRAVLGALNVWGDRHRRAPEGSASACVEAATGAVVELRFVAADGRVLEPGEVALVRREQGGDAAGTTAGAAAGR